LCAQAKGGQTLVSRRVLAAVEDVVTVESIGELTLKGFQRPVPTFNVVEWADASRFTGTPAASQ
jgi:class 3 adenylate cyclase